MTYEKQIIMHCGHAVEKAKYKPEIAEFFQDGLLAPVATAIVSETVACGECGDKAEIKMVPIKPLYRFEE